MGIWSNYGVDPALEQDLDYLYNKYASKLNELPGAPFRPGSFSTKSMDKWSDSDFGAARRAFDELKKDVFIEELALNNRAGRLARSLPPFEEMREFLRAASAFAEARRQSAIDYKKFIMRVLLQDGFDLKAIAPDDVNGLLEALLEEVRKEIGVSAKMSPAAVLDDIVNNPNSETRRKLFGALREITARALTRFGFDKMSELFARDKVNLNELKSCNPFLYTFLAYEVMLDVGESFVGQTGERRVFDCQDRIRIFANVNSDKEKMKEDVRRVVEQGHGFILEMAMEEKDLRLSMGSKMQTVSSTEMVIGLKRGQISKVKTISMNDSSFECQMLVNYQIAITKRV